MSKAKPGRVGERKALLTDVSDYTKLYESRLLKKTPEEKLERIRRLVRQGLPHAMTMALIILITRR